MTRILAIDTSSAWCSVALSLGDAEPIFRHRQVAAGASQLLLPWVDEMLLEARLALTELDAIAIGIGPGAFTGVRLGVAVVQGLAVAADLPVIPVASLDAIALQLANDLSFQKIKPNHFAVAIDARMDEIYWAKYQCDLHDHPPQRLGDIHLDGPESIDLEGMQYLAGNAINAYGSRLFGQHQLSADRLNPEISISALGVLDYAKLQYHRDELCSAHSLEPLYIRNKVAFTTEEREQAFKKNT